MQITIAFDSKNASEVADAAAIVAQFAPKPAMPALPAISAILVPNTASHPGAVQSGIAIPKWAPFGSYWTPSEVPGGKMTLRGPDGVEIPWTLTVDDRGAVQADPFKAPEPTADAGAAAAGQALQQAIQGNG